ncbi:MAG: hypothetical protein ACJA0P_004020, partial [Planctomycetota bacterium]
MLAVAIEDLGRDPRATVQQHLGEEHLVFEHAAKVVVESADVPDGLGPGREAADGGRLGPLLQHVDEVAGWVRGTVGEPERANGVL